MNLKKICSITMVSLLSFGASLNVLAANTYTVSTPTYRVATANATGSCSCSG